MIDEETWGLAPDPGETVDTTKLKIYSHQNYSSHTSLCGRTWNSLSIELGSCAKAIAFFIVSYR